MSSCSSLNRKDEIMLCLDLGKGKGKGNEKVIGPNGSGLLYPHFFPFLFLFSHKILNPNTAQGSLCVYLVNVHASLFGWFSLRNGMERCL